jgi:hypothetical protein
MGATPESATLSHVVAYLQSYSRRGTFLTKWGPRCVPGPIKNQIGYLRKPTAAFDGRIGPYT